MTPSSKKTAQRSLFGGELDDRLSESERSSYRNTDNNDAAASSMKSNDGGGNQFSHGARRLVGSNSVQKCPSFLDKQKETLKSSQRRR